jgi:hypothetical protein
MTDLPLQDRLNQLLSGGRDDAAPTAPPPTLPIAAPAPARRRSGTACVVAVVLLVLVFLWRCSVRRRNPDRAAPWDDIHAPEQHDRADSDDPLFQPF